MSQQPLTSLQRVLTSLGQREPDQVPLFLPLTTHGAQELGLSIREYFARPDYVAEAQVRMWHRWGADFLYNFSYAAAEVEAWGGEAQFFDDGPPNAGAPVVGRAEDVLRLETPRVADVPALQRVLRATELMRAQAGPDVPIVGVVMAPFSLPVMQLGFSAYLDLLYERRSLVEHLMRLNEEFCVEWANAQLAAGATAIGYFDPVSSPTITSRDLYLEFGLAVAKRTLPRISGPTATLMASGATLPIIDDVATTGTAIIGVSSSEDLAEAKQMCAGRITVMGNLNGIEMRRWSPSDAEAAVKDAIARCGRGGGFILADTHGEIPWQVATETLDAIGAAVQTWGRYPLDWIEAEPET